MLNKNTFIAWLLRRGFVRVGTTDTFEKGDVQYIARIQSLGVRTRLSANRWSAEESFRYNRRVITPADTLGWR